MSKRIDVLDAAYEDLFRSGLSDDEIMDVAERTQRRAPEVTTTYKYARSLRREMAEALHLKRRRSEMRLR